MIALVRGVIAASSCAGSIVKRRGLDVDEDRPWRRRSDRRHGGDEGERHGDDLVARPDAGGEQRQVQGARAGVDGDRVLGAAIGGELALERRRPRRRARTGRVEDAEHGGVDLGLDARGIAPSDRETGSCDAPHRFELDDTAALGHAMRCGLEDADDPQAGLRRPSSGVASLLDAVDEMREASTPSASVMSSCGAHMSPVR